MSGNIAFAVWAAALVVMFLWMAYSSGRTAGYWAGYNTARARMQTRLELRDAARAADGERFATLVAQHARQRLRLRGTLREARRWKAVAVRLGWRRPSSTLPAPDDTVAMAAAEDIKRGDTLAVGRDGRVWHWSTVVYGARSAPQPPPEPVEPTMVILPPQESAEAAERMAAEVRRILGEAFDGAARGGA